MAAFFGHRSKSTTALQDECKEANKRDALENVKLETQAIFFPLLEKKFGEVKEKFPDQKEIIVYVRACHNARFEFTTVPETEKEVEINPCKSGNREMLFMALKIANDYDIKALPYIPEWNGWVFPFSRTYP